MDIDLLPSKAEIVREAVRRGGLHEFFRRFWVVADQKCPCFIDNWHFGAIAAILTAVSKRQVLNVVINIPPGLGKSLSVDVLWPAWHWGPFEDPVHSWMSISFDQSLTLRNARQLQTVISSPLYHAAWPEFLPGPPRQAVREFTNGHGGYRFSTSFKGKGTGRHVNTQTLDDPLKPKDAFNQRAIEEANDTWCGTFSSRAIDRRTFARVVIMQRLAENDPSGKMLEEFGYEHLCLPMRHVPNAYWDRGNSLGIKDPRTEPGELLFPSRIPEESVRKAEKELGSPAQVEAQMQQNPTPMVGGVVEKAWLSHEWEVLPQDLEVYQSWDFGFKGKKATDPTAELMESGRSRVHAVLLGHSISADRTFLLSEMQPRAMNFPESKEAFLEIQEKDLWRNATTILVEDKANGTGILDDLESDLLKAIADRNLAAKAQKLKRICTAFARIVPTEGKLERLIRHTSYMKQGCLLVPNGDRCEQLGFTTLEPWKNEIVGFPKMRWNDRVDTLTQGLDFARSKERAYLNALTKLKN